MTSQSRLHEMSSCYTCCDRDAGISDGADTCGACHAHQVSGQDCDVQLFLEIYECGKSPRYEIMKMWILMENWGQGINLVPS